LPYIYIIDPRLFLQNMLLCPVREVKCFFFNRPILRNSIPDLLLMFQTEAGGRVESV